MRRAEPGRDPRHRAPRTAGAALACFLGRTSPRLLIALVLLAAGLRASIGRIAWADALVALSILLCWPLLEWLIHVHILHLRPRNIGPLRWDLGVARDHRRHHADPWNLRWVFIPRYVFVPALALLAVVALSAPDPHLAMTGVTAFLLLALHYEWSHYLAHIDWCPPLDYYRRRVREHRLHHFRNHRLWWGLSLIHI